MTDTPDTSVPLHLPYSYFKADGASLDAIETMQAAKKEHEKITYLFNRGSKKLLLAASIILAAYLALSPLISQFLKISIIPVLLLTPFLIISVLIALNRGILQGLQKFNALGINIITEGILKVALAFLFIYLGFKSGGANARACRVCSCC